MAVSERNDANEKSREIAISASLRRHEDEAAAPLLLLALTLHWYNCVGGANYSGEGSRFALPDRMRWVSEKEWAMAAYIFGAVH